MEDKLKRAVKEYFGGMRPPDSLEDRLRRRMLSELKLYRRLAYAQAAGIVLLCLLLLFNLFEGREYETMSAGTAHYHIIFREGVSMDEVSDILLKHKARIDGPTQAQTYELIAKEPEDVLRELRQKGLVKEVLR